MDFNVSFAQLWREEKPYLFEQALRLDRGAVIVEIGTGQGGATFLLAKGTEGRECSIFSYDVHLAKEVERNLDGLNVRVFAQDSATGAAAWPHVCGRPIDLLFIDGAHTLAGVHSDFEHWIKFLRPGGRILFHDYDPKERGGIPHLGVRVMLDAALKESIFSNTEHVGRILSANVPDPVHSTIPAQACADALRTIGKGVVALHTTDFRGWTVVGARNARTELIVASLHAEDVRWSPEIPEAPAEPGVLIVERPLSDRSRESLQRAIKPVLLIDDLQAAYLLYFGMSGRLFDVALARTSNRLAFFKQLECLQMFDHAWGGALKPDELFRDAPADIAQLSRFCACEHVRLAQLERLRDSIILDEPGA